MEKTALSGLGLTISSRLVKLMGGRMWVESQPGEGSLFHFTIRVAVLPVERAEPVEVPQLAGIRTLIVDDRPANRRILAEVVEACGTEPTLAFDAAEALRALEEAARDQMPFKLILLDSQMPEVDGFAVATELRHHRRIPPTAIVMLTSALQHGTEARCRELGIAASVAKPINRSQLMEGIRLALGGESPESSAGQGSHAQPVPSAPKLATGAPLRILLAEDNPVNQKVAARLLQNWGHLVMVANDGLEAVAAFERDEFDLVLMDAQMPGMDGFEATQAIREKEKLRSGHVPIIALTAHAMSGDRDRCLAAGMDGYASKPIRADDLLAEMARVRSMPATPAAVER
jgi:CheY-like chemotaxis protein